MFFNFLKTVFLLYFFYLFIMFCSASVISSIETTTVMQKTKNYFLTKEHTEDIENYMVDEEENKFDSFTISSLSYVNNILIVIAQACKNTEHDKRCNIVKSHINFKNFISSGNSNVPKNVFVENNYSSVWKKKDITKNRYFSTKLYSTVVNNKDIYLFFINHKKLFYSNFHPKWEYKLIYGVIKKIKNNSEIMWKNISHNIKKKLKLNSKNTKKYINLVASKSSGIITDTKIIIPVMYSNINNMFSSLIIVEKNNIKNLTLLPSSIPPNCIYPAVVEWKNKKLIMMTSCSDGIRRVYEFSDIKKTWTEAVGSLSRVWGNAKKRTQQMQSGQCSFISANIKIKKQKEKKVILFTQLVENKNGKYDLHLWMTNYRQVYDVGVIATELELFTLSILLHKNEHLFVAYDKVNDGNSFVYVIYLKNKLETIKKTLEAWKTQDELLSKSCFANDFTLTTKGQCKANIPTKGLVGLLSSNYSNNDWTDIYLCVNATLNKNKGDIINVKSGLMFSGIGVGATWRVGKDEQNQPYHFANYGFTLVAAIKINNYAIGTVNSILGFDLKEDNNNKNGIGLWCSNKKWFVSNEKDITNATSTLKTCIAGETYLIMLSWKNNKFSVYIDGDKLTRLPYYIMNISSPLNITHFYFGVNTNKEQQNKHKSFITVKNVLLYNQLFDYEKVKNLKVFVEMVKNIKTLTTNKHINKHKK